MKLSRRRSPRAYTHVGAEALLAGGEVCALLTGACNEGVWRCALHILAVGSSTAVEFDWRKIWAREDRLGDVIGFFHTHPGGFARPTRRDIQTMRAWCDCLGKQLLCVICTQCAGKRVLDAFVFSNCRSRGRWVALLDSRPTEMAFKG